MIPRDSPGTDFLTHIRCYHSRLARADQDHDDQHKNHDEYEDTDHDLLGWAITLAVILGLWVGLWLLLG